MDQSLKIVCVTGAGGYIASWLVSKLLESGYTVHGTVRDPADEKKNGHLSKLPGAAERLKLFKADLLDYDSLVPAIHGCVGVFHTACPVAPTYSTPEDVLGPAIEGTRNVMNACRQEASIKRVIFTSSGAAVGYDPKRSKDDVVDESCWTDPEHCKKIQSWYTLAKTQAEMLAWDLAKEYKIDLVSIVPCIVLGPILQCTINTSLKFLTSLIDGSSEAYAIRSFPVVDVRDVAEAHVQAFENPGATGRYLCFNVATSSEEMLECLRRNFPDLPHAKKIGEAGLNGFKFSNKKILGHLLNEFTPLEKTVVDTITSVQERGLIS